MADIAEENAGDADVADPAMFGATDGTVAMGNEHGLAAFLHRVARVAQLVSSGELEPRMFNWSDIEETAVAYAHDVLLGNGGAAAGAGAHGIADAAAGSRLPPVAPQSEATIKLEERQRTTSRALTPQRRKKRRSQVAVTARDTKVLKNATRFEEWLDAQGFETQVQAAQWLNERMDRRYNSSTIGMWVRGDRPLPEEVQKVIWGV